MQEIVQKRLQPEKDTAGKIYFHRDSVVLIFCNDSVKDMKQIDTDILLSKLTEKQFDVLACLMFDISNKTIGRTLNISDRL